MGSARARSSAGARPKLDRGDVGARKQPVRWLPARFPLRRALQIARILAEPVEIGLEGLRQRSEPGTEAGTRPLGLRIAEEVVETGKLRRRLRVPEGASQHRDDALAVPDGLIDLPGADVGLGRRRGGHEDDRVAIANERAEPPLPVLAGRDAVPVERRLEPAEAKRRVDHVREVEIVATVRDEDVDLVVLLGRLRHRSPLKCEKT